MKWKSASVIMTPLTLESPHSFQRFTARSCHGGQVVRWGIWGVGIFAAMTTGIDMDHHRRQFRLGGKERMAHLFGYLVTLPGREVQSLDMVDNSISPCERISGWFSPHSTVQVG